MNYAALFVSAKSGEDQTEKPQLIGLIDVEGLKNTATTPTSSNDKPTSSADKPASGSPGASTSIQRAGFEPTSGKRKSPLNASPLVTCAKVRENALKREAPLKTLPAS